MFNLILKFFQSRTTTFEKAKLEGEISQEILVYDKENLLVCGNGIFKYDDEESLRKLIVEQEKAIEGGGQ